MVLFYIFYCSTDTCCTHKDYRSKFFRDGV